jgi:sterol desaturase/sphingolipid hydroxylase (fatty acid hydroxylase superfamily)
MDLIHALGRVLELAIGWVFSPSWLPPHDFSFYKWLIVPGYGYGFVLITFAVLELVLPQQRRPWTRSTLLSGTYLLLAGKMGVYALIVTPAMRHAYLALGLPSAHLDRVLPLWLYMPVAVIIVTFFAYWSHRLMHRVPVLWQLHKVHHSAQNLNCTSVYHKHFLETLLETPSHLLAVLALGTDLVAPFGIIFKTIDVLGHSNVRLDFGRLAYFISTPQAHRTHHSIEPRHYDTNFGNTFMIWDHVFGTFHYDPEHPASAYGVDEDIPVSFARQQVLPFVWIARRARARVIGLPERFLRSSSGVNVGHSMPSPPKLNGR